MKRFLILFFCVLTLFIYSCKQKDEETLKLPDENVKDSAITQEKDKSGHEIKDNKVIIPAKELEETFIEFFTRLSLGDVSALDYAKFSDNNTKVLEKLLNDENGKLFFQKLLATFEIQSSDFKDAKFNIENYESTSSQNENMSQIGISGKDYTKLKEVIKIKNEEKFPSDSEFLSFLDRFNTYYDANIRIDDAVHFLYDDSKIKVDGDSFLKLFDIFDQELDPNLGLESLYKNLFLKTTEATGALKDVVDLLKQGEYIYIYEYLRKAEVLTELSYNPTDTVKNLYKLPEDTRKQFLDRMRDLPKPLVKTFQEDGMTKVMVIYYFKDGYYENPTNKMVQQIFYADSIRTLDASMIDNVIKSVLVDMGIQVI